MWRRALAVLICIGAGAALAAPHDPLKDEWDKLVKEAKKTPALSRSAVESLGADDPYRVFFKIQSRLSSGELLSAAEAADLRGRLSAAEEQLATMRRYGTSPRGQRSTRDHYTQSETASQIVDEMQNLCERWLQREAAKVVQATGPLAGANSKVPAAKVPQESDIGATRESLEVADTGDVNPRQGLVTLERQEALRKVPVARVEFIRGFGTPEGVLRLPRASDMDRAVPFTPTGNEPVVRVERMPSGKSGVTVLGLGVVEGYQPEAIEFVSKGGERLEIPHKLWVDPTSQTYFVRTDVPIPKGAGYRLLLSKRPAHITPTFVAGPEAKETLSFLLNKNGFRNIYYAVESEAELSDDSWAGAIRRTSDYTFDPRFKPGQGNDQDPLAKFKPTAKYGHAHLQCTTAAGLTDGGLKVIVPKDSSLTYWVEGGYVVPPGGLVTEADAHCWNALAQDGALKILDATPAITRGGGGTGGGSISNDRLSKLNPHWLLYAVASSEPPVSGLVEWSRHTDPLHTRVPLSPALDQGLSAEVATVERQLLETHGLLDLGRRIEILYEESLNGGDRPLTRYEVEAQAQSRANQGPRAVARARLYLEDETLPDPRGPKSGASGSSQESLRPMESWDQVEAFAKRVVPLLLRADAAVGAADQRSASNWLTFDGASGLPHFNPSVENRLVHASKSELLENVAAHRIQDYVDSQIQRAHRFLGKFYRGPTDMFSKDSPMLKEGMRISADLKAASHDPIKLGPLLDSVWSRIRPFLIKQPIRPQRLGASKPTQNALVVTPHQYAAWRSFLAGDPRYLEHRDARAVELGRKTFSEFLNDPVWHSISLKSLMDDVEGTAPKGCATRTALRVGKSLRVKPPGEF